ncbi:kinase-like domain-containing protein [Mycena alexandri]|uniref:Kinase-like domain-containing protein n=1 Tax=Mycena alexandri TaxID=1745969 RepID=A0AAD6XAU7_9AGAR|nr:kinase-like domain-containing protein [Mycena alexandri]
MATHTAASLGKEYQTLLNTTYPEGREQIQAVFQSFNLEALAKRAGSVMGKESTSIFPIAQGGYNSVFAVTFGDGTDVLVRIAGSCRHAPLSDELAKLVFDSEIATLKYLQANTSIPIPEVYYSNSDRKKAGARFMIIQRFDGIPVHYVWDDLSFEQQKDIVAQWMPMQAELSKQKFNAIGCLTTEAGAVGPLLPSSIAEDILRAPHWGPFRSTPESLEGHVRSALDGLAANTEKRAFLKHLLVAIRTLPTDKFHNERLILIHGDLSFGNLLHTSPNKIVGVIDWEGSRVLPVWAAFQQPDFMCGMPSEEAVREILEFRTEDTSANPGSAT